MKPYEWMTTYTPQKEWIEKKGIFMPLAFYFGALGCGLYLVSLYFDILPGMFIGWLIVAVLKGGAHLIDLGKPLRAWRMILKPQTSWISRGMIFVLLFLGLAPVQLCLSYFLPGTIWEILFKILGGATAFAASVYPGFTLNFINAISLWNSAMLPMLFLVIGALGGTALLAIVQLFGGDIDVNRVQALSAILIVITFMLIGVFTMSVSYRGPSGKHVVKQMLKGEASIVFWVGILIIGIVLPFVGALIEYTGSPYSKLALLLSALGEIICGISLAYVILKNGIFAPLIPLSNDVQ